MAAAAHQTRNATARFDSVEQEAYLNLWRTYDRLRTLEDEVFGEFGLTAQQYNVLRLLKAARPDPLPTLTVADRLVSKAPDITRMVDRLEKAGLATRERPAHDRRTVLVGITPAGVALVDQIARPLRECHERQLGHLPPAALQQLTELLHAARQPHESDGSVWK